MSMSNVSDNPFEKDASTHELSEASEIYDAVSEYHSDSDNENDEDIVQISEMDSGKAILAQQDIYNKLLAERIKFQKKMQHFNNLQEMPAIEVEISNDLETQLSNYYGMLTENKKFKSYNDLDILYNRLLDESQQDTKLKGMQPVSEQINNILDKDMDRLIKKTKLNRLTKVEDVDFFDDSDFYAMMLKEYLEQKSDNPDAQAKIKKFKQSIKIHTRQVDRKGSKAKLLNTEKVHEKIKGFVPAITRYKGLWEEDNIDMLISGLFGQSIHHDNAVTVAELEETFPIF